MTVHDQIRDLARELAAARATPCANCSHALYLHHGPCEYPLWPKPGTKRCRCKSFVDPAPSQGAP